LNIKLYLFILLFLNSILLDAEEFRINYKYDSIVFEIYSPNTTLDNSLYISYSYENTKKEFFKKIDGIIYKAKIANLNHDLYPEVYIFSVSHGSGSYGELFAYTINENGLLIPIYMPNIKNKYYMGHDEFFIQGDSIDRTFPIYKSFDINANPTGGIKKIIYKLVKEDNNLSLLPQLKNK